MKQAQEFLKQYLLAQKRVAALCSQIEILGNLAARATRASNTGGKAPDAMADAVAALADAKDLLRAQVEELEASRRRVQELIASLPDETHFREVLTLRFVLEWSSKEIARTLGLSVGAVNTRISRGRAMLIQRLKEVGYDYDRT